MGSMHAQRCRMMDPISFEGQETPLKLGSSELRSCTRAEVHGMYIGVAGTHTRNGDGDII